jgi:DNA primase
MEVKVADLPNDEDPASIAQRDPEMWKQILRGSKNVIQFALEKARAQKSGIALVKEVEKKVLPYITFIKSEVEKSHFVRLIADAIHTSEDSIWKEIAKIKLEEPNRSFDPNKEKVEIKNEIRVNPKRILAGIIFSGLSPGLKEETVDRLGEEKTLQILEEFDAEKESLSFEIESYSGPSALEMIGREILDRIELELIQNDLREMTRELDKLKSEDQDEVSTKIKRITERSRELQEKINR